DLTVEPERARGDPHFADERGAGRTAQRQHGNTSPAEQSMTDARAAVCAPGPKRPGGCRSAGDDEVDGLRTLALFIGLDVEGEALPLAQRFEPGPLDGGDVHEHVAAAIVGLDEAVAALGVEELDRTCHGHPETPSPVVAPPPAPTARRLGRTFTNGESSGLTASVTPPAPTGGGTSKPAR